jgi:hypothetical protein
MVLEQTVCNRMPSAPSPAATDQELRAAYRLLGVDFRASELVIRLRLIPSSEERSALNDAVREASFEWSFAGLPREAIRHRRG